MTDRIPGFATLAIHAGAQPDPTTGARATPIYQTTSFVFEDVDHAASLFGLQTFGNIYTRIGNPTNAVLEERVAALEGGTAGLAVASGHAAQIVVMHCLMRPGDELVAAKKLYGGSINQFNHAFKNFGWNVVWAEPDDIGTFERAVSPKTKAIFIESIANPGGVITDIEAIGKIAKSAGVPLIVDNTLATPYLCKPIDYGADVVVHSLTKFLGGHGNSIGGLIVDGGTFNWSREKRCASRGPNITASCCTRPSATSPSPSPAACWRCATSGRRCRRSMRSSSSPESRRCRCGCSGTATMPWRWRNGSSTAARWRG
jgi:O-acetylhomoserine (thiol)-lyase